MLPSPSHDAYAAVVVVRTSAVSRDHPQKQRREVAEVLDLVGKLVEQRLHAVQRDLDRFERLGNARRRSRRAPAAASGSSTPPGVAQDGWMRLPPSSSMMRWPNFRSRMPRRAKSGSCSSRPKMLRLAGSESKPSSRSGEDRWKKLSACDCRICAVVHQPAQQRRRRRNLDAEQRVAGLGAGQHVAHRADAADARHQRRASRGTAGPRRSSRSRGIRPRGTAPNPPRPRRPRRWRSWRDPRYGLPE